MGKLQLIKSEKFGIVSCDFWQDSKGDMWFTREQIGQALEYSDPRDAIETIHRRNKDRLDKFSVTFKLTATDGKDYDTTVYSQKGLNEVCRFSRQPKADSFMDWVWDVVESIRKHGMYAKDELLNNPDLMIEILTRLKKEREEKRLLQAANAEMSPKAESFDTFMSAVGYLSIEEVAKTLNLPGVGRNKLFDILTFRGILFKSGNSYRAKQEYVNRGYFTHKQVPVKKGDVIEQRTQVFVTPKGLDWLNEKLRKLA